jgi:hypothetical protein
MFSTALFYGELLFLYKIIVTVSAKMEGAGSEMVDLGSDRIRKTALNQNLVETRKTILYLYCGHK